MTIPNFFIVGAPKSGTTALAAYLTEHPNVFFSTPKEPHHFDRDLYRDFKISRETYLSLFKKADARIHKAVGEASVSYLYSDCAVAEILRFNPEARFIAMLRNPVDLVPSWHAQKVWEGREDIMDFAEAWHAQEDRKNGRRPSPWGWETKALLYSEWGLLGSQVERLLKQIAGEKVKLILYDDFAADTKKIYGETLDFLELPQDGRTQFPRINESKKVRSPRLQQALGLVKLNAERIKRMLGISRAGGLVNLLFSMNSFPASRVPLPENLRSEMAEFYAPDVEKLSRILDRDLSHWLSAPQPVPENKK